MSKKNNELDPERQIIEQTKCWLSNVIIAHNYCPFAKREIEQNRVRYQVINEFDPQNCLEILIQECVYLQQNPEVETTLIVLPKGLGNFETYLDFIAVAEDLLVSQKYEGVFQMASFHPDYCFQGSEGNDPANFTNRSPYPMIHLLREASITKVLEHYPDPELIPERNIEFARSQGLEVMQKLLQDCLKKAK